jgi:DNA-binding CsgD family transcriptional regulator
MNLYEGSIQSRTNLAALWRASCEGRLFFSETYCAGGRAFALVAPSPRRNPLPVVGASMLERVFEGESQKTLAIESNLSVATVATHCANALRAVTQRPSVSHAPIILVMASLAARGLPLGPARLEEERRDGGWLLSVDVPGATFHDRLSTSEQDVARLSIEGHTHAEMARSRGTSRRTVANQMAAVFHKLHISGRGALRAKAIREYATGHSGPPPAMPCIAHVPAPLTSVTSTAQGWH